MWYLTAPSCTNQQSMQGSNSKLSARYVHVLYVLGLCLCFFPRHESRCTILLKGPFGFLEMEQEQFYFLKISTNLCNNSTRNYSMILFLRNRTSPNTRGYMEQELNTDSFRRRRTKHRNATLPERYGTAKLKTARLPVYREKSDACD